MSTQSQHPGTGQQDQKQRNPGAIPQEQDKYAREEHDKSSAKKDKDPMGHEGGRNADDKDNSNLGRR